MTDPSPDSRRKPVAEELRGAMRRRDPWHRVVRAARAHRAAILLALAVALVGLLLAARSAGVWAPVHALRETAENRGGVRLLAYRVRHDAPDHLALEVKYSYDGDRREPLFAGASTSDRGRHLGHWAYRPDPVLPGVHWARVLLTLNDQAPPRHRTTAIDLEIHVGGGPQVARASATYPKEWVKSKGPLRCHRLWGLGCSD